MIFDMRRVMTRPDAKITAGVSSTGETCGVIDFRGDVFGVGVGVLIGGGIDVRLNSFQAPEIDSYK